MGKFDKKLHSDFQKYVSVLEGGIFAHDLGEYYANVYDYDMLPFSEVILSDNSVRISNYLDLYPDVDIDKKTGYPIFVSDSEKIENLRTLYNSGGKKLSHILQNFFNLAELTSSVYGLPAKAFAGNGDLKLINSNLAQYKEGEYIDGIFRPVFLEGPKRAFYEVSADYVKSVISFQKLDP